MTPTAFSQNLCISEPSMLFSTVLRLSVLLSLLAPLPALAARAPRLSVSSLDNLKQPLPLPL